MANQDTNTRSFVKKKHHLTDHEIITAVQAGGAARAAALQYLYLKSGLREAVNRTVLDQGGSMADAQDVFQESFVLLDRNLREGRFEGRSTLSTYLVAIAKWKWLGMRRQEGRYTELAAAQYDTEVESPEVSAIDQEQRALLAAALEQIGERCKQLLGMYQMDYSMAEIAQAMGYQSQDVAKKEAYRCRMKLREKLRTDA